MKKIIEVSSLVKRYGAVNAVKGIDFYVEQGTLFAFLGANGAGKSTTIDILSTLLAPDSGSVQIAGHKLGEEDAEIRKSIGIVFQDNVLDRSLTVKENLMIRASFYDLSRQKLNQAVKRAIEIADVGDFLNRPYGKLSGGQRRRADIARALTHTPDILFLDEPTTGLDPQTRQSLWQTIQALQKETGMTVFLTTHYMEEAAQADYIVVMGEGSVLAKGTPIELKQGYSVDLLKLKPRDRSQLAHVLSENHIAYKLHGEILEIPLSNTLEAIGIVEKVKEHIVNIEISNGTMDDAFINIIGRRLQA